MSKIENRKHGDKAQLARALKSSCKLITLQQTLSVYASQYATRKINGTVNANSLIEASKHNAKCELETYIVNAVGKVGEAWARVQTLAVSSSVTDQATHDALMLACDTTVADALAVVKKAAKPSNAMANAVGLICADIGKVTPNQRAALLQALGTVPAPMKPAIRKVTKGAAVPA